MTPRLIAVAGPLRGMVFELNGGDVVIGRDQANQISSADKSLSRKHCLIKREGDVFVAIDLESHNGTFVNDVPIRKQDLHHADRIRVGSLYFLLLLHEDQPESAPKSIQCEGDDLLTLSVTRFDVEQALYSMARDLNVVMKISSSLGSMESTHQLQKTVLEALLEVIPAERAVIFLGDSLNQPNSMHAIDRVNDSANPVPVSRTVAHQVLSEGVAILSDDVIKNPAFASAESLIGLDIRSLICVPLIVSGRVSGFIYLDASRQSAHFDEGHLRTVTMIAGIVAGPLERAQSTDHLKWENARLRAELSSSQTMIGESSAIKRAYDFISKVAPRDSTVLILGESGTGKELAAREIHNHSPRASGPFVAVNCASLTESLLESELFGHEKGSFTGAIAQKKGKLEAAAGGTIFLDEVGEMFYPVQAKLLRVLQNCEFERVGSTRSIRSDVRVIAATNRNLKDAISSGLFREDLYYRLNVVQMTIPPLRERREDIPLLANYFVARHGERCKRSVAGITPAARRCLMEYDWPGNIRELENAIERAVVLGSSDYIEPEDLPDSVTEAGAGEGNQATGDYQYLVKEAKKQILLRAIDATGGNYSAAAKMLGVHAKNLHRLMRSVGLRASARD